VENIIYMHTYVYQNYAQLQLTSKCAININKWKRRNIKQLCMQINYSNNNKLNNK